LILILSLDNVVVSIKEKYERKPKIKVDFTRKSCYKECIGLLEEMIGECDCDVARWKFSGKHIVDFFDIPPMGKDVESFGITFIHVSNGRFRDGWVLYDSLWLWQQLDVLPETSQFPEGAIKSEQVRR
jgi:hypothetical protein